jgi:hypothetical protein
VSANDGPRALEGGDLGTKYKRVCLGIHGGVAIGEMGQLQEVLFRYKERVNKAPNTLPDWSFALMYACEKMTNA